MGSENFFQVIYNKFFPDSKIVANNEREKVREERDEKAGTNTIMCPSLIIEKFIKVLEEISSDKQQADSTAPQSQIESEGFFETLNSSNITLKEYVIRIIKYLNPSTSSFVISLILMDRIIVMNPNKISLNRNTVHKLLMSALLIAIKMNEDEHFDNKFYAKVAGVRLEELNFLEMLFCELIGFTLFISPKIYLRYYKRVQHYKINNKC